jgi:hypothetical protein
MDGQWSDYGAWTGAGLILKRRRGTEVEEVEKEEKDDEAVGF